MEQSKYLAGSALPVYQVFPVQAHFCPACGHPVDQKASLPDVNNVLEVTVTVAKTQQEGTSVTAAQATLSAQQTSLSVLGTTTEQPGAGPPLAVVAQPESQFPKESATEAKTTEDKVGREEQEEEEEEGPVATFRKRRIAFKTLSRPFQVLLALTLAQIAVVALLLATENLASASGQQQRDCRGTDLCGAARGFHCPGCLAHRRYLVCAGRSAESPLERTLPGGRTGNRDAGVLPYLPTDDHHEPQGRAVFDRSASALDTACIAGALLDMGSGRFPTHMAYAAEKRRPAT